MCRAAWVLMLLMLLMLGACDIPPPQVTVDNVTIDIPVSTETCPGVYTAAILRRAAGEMPTPEQLDLFKDASDEASAGMGGSSDQSCDGEEEVQP